MTLLLLGLILGTAFFIDAPIPEVSAHDVAPLPCAWNGRASFIDGRDHREYRQQELGGRCWMAENLGYGKQVEDMRQDDETVHEMTCYQNKPENCRLLGGLYTWSEAMTGICPSGWRLPKDGEWTALERALDSSVAVAAEGWRGEDLSGKLTVVFGVRFAGIAVSSWFFSLGRGAYFWTSTSYSSAAAWSRGVIPGTGRVFRGPSDKQAGVSVRCVRNP